VRTLAILSFNFSDGDLHAVLAGLFWSFCVILMRVSGFKIRPVALTLFKSFAAIARSLLFAWGA
jgi:hypothetical protein